MTGTHPQVSVVMSIFNSEDTLRETLDSVLSQTGCEFEFIVINDGSTDSTARILDARAVLDSRLRVVHQENTGLTRALIRGCEMARAEYIARQDCGDLSLPGRIAAQVDHMKTRPTTVIVGCDYELVGPNGELLRVHVGSRDGAADLLDRKGKPVPGPHHGTVMFRTQSYRSVGGYRDAFYFAQDIDLWTRMLEVGDLAYVSGVFYRVKFERESITARHRPAQEKLREIILRAAAERRDGQSDAMLLDVARMIRPSRNGTADGGQTRSHIIDADYFVASCLFERRDRRARGYLWRVICARPTRWRAWSKLVLSYLHKW